MYDEEARRLARRVLIMPTTDFYVTQGGGAADVNGGGPSLGAQDGPVSAPTNCTATHTGGGVHTIVDNTAGGGFANTLVNDFICWDTAGAKERARVTVKTDSNNITVQRISSTVAFTNLANKPCNVGGAFLTIDYACSTLTSAFINAANDPRRLFIRAGSGWSESATIDFNGTAAAPFYIEGYTTTPGDGASSYTLIDGGGVRPFAFTGSGSMFVEFWHFSSTNHTSHGFNLGDNAGLRHCEGWSNGGSGASLGLYGYAIDCAMYDNSGNGLALSTAGRVNGGLFYGNAATTGQITVGTYGQILNTIVQGLPTNGRGIALSGGRGSLSHNTVFGAGVAGTSGVYLLAGACNEANLFRDNIVHDVAVCINAASASRMQMIDYNLLQPASGGTTLTNVIATNTVTGDPLFVDAVTGDLSLELGSPARGAASDGGDLGAVPFAATTDASIHLAKALLCNKRTHDIETGVDVIYDDNGSTVLMTLTPTEVDGVVTLEPTPGAAGTPVDAVDELHLVTQRLTQVQHTVATGVLDVLDDDGSTVLRTLTPAESEGVVTIAAS